MSVTVAIIGGGPAGGGCDLDLASGGVRTVLFERNIQREKPCGGGLTWRAYQAFPELAHLHLPARKIRHFHAISPDGHPLNLILSHPIHIVSRRDLDQRARPRAAGDCAAWRAL